MALNLHTQLSPESTEAPILHQKNAGATKGAPNLPNIIHSYQQSWYKRFDNIGAGNKSDSAGATALNWTATVLSGGALGSYGLSREDTLNKKIDEVVREKNARDFNATYKLTDVFTRASDKVAKLSDKIEVCDALEGDLKEYMEQNRRSIEIFETLRNTINPGILGRVRGGIANAWESVKDTALGSPASTVGVTTVGVAGVAVVGPGAIASAAGSTVAATAGAGFSAAAFLGAKLGALGAAAIANPLFAIPVAGGALVAAGIGAHNLIRDKKSLQMNMEMLQKMLASTQGIKAKTQEERDRILNKANAHYGNEQQVEKNLRDLIQLRAPHEIVAFEKALQPGASTESELRALLGRLKATPGFFHENLESKLTERYFEVLYTRRSKNLRKMTNTLLGAGDVSGVDGIGRLAEKLEKMNTMTGVRGKTVTLTLAGQPSEAYTLVDLVRDGKESALVLQDPTDPNKRMALKIIKDGETYKIKEVRPAVSFTDISTELAAHEGDFDFTPPRRARGKILFDKAQKSFLTMAEYKDLVGYLKLPLGATLPKTDELIKKNIFEETGVKAVPTGTSPDHNLKIS